jgi:hypothetical protein
MVGGNEVTLHGPAVVRHEVEFVDADLGEHGEHLLRDAFVAVVAGPLFGLAVAFEVAGDAAVGAGECGHLMVPLEPGVWNAVEEEDCLGSAGPGFDIVPADLLVVARGLDEAMSESYPVEDFSISFLVWLAWFDRGKMGCPFIDELLWWNGTTDGLLSPLVEGAVFGSCHCTKDRALVVGATSKAEPMPNVSLVELVLGTRSDM